MRSKWNDGRLTSSMLLTVAVLLGGASAAGNAATVDFDNPATAISSDAVFASGTCIAKYVVILDDASKPAAEIGQRVAKRCAREISKSAGLASFMIGKPEDYAKNLKYAQEELTTNAVLRARATRRRTFDIELRLCSSQQFVDDQVGGLLG